MTDGEALKRLGGGRWRTADGRFTIEPQSGTWVVLDAQQVDDLGLPLVRGPFASLTAARSGIEAARTGAAPVSPLATRLEDERRNPRPVKPVVAKARPAAAIEGGRAVRTKAAEPVPPKLPKPPEPPPEPAWLGKLPPAHRAAGRKLLQRLTDAGIPSAEAVARAELVEDQPAVARLALERQLRAVLDRHRSDRAALATAIIGLLGAGDDDELQVRWRLVDGEDRSMAPLELPIMDPLRPRRSGR